LATYLQRITVIDRASRLFSAQQEAIQRSSGLNWLFHLMLIDIGRCDALVF
jgi:hypothetical protein